MQESRIEEKRNAYRFLITAPLTYSFLYANEFNDAQTQDISTRGIGFIAGKELKPSTPLEIWLNMPDDSQRIYIRAEVVWSDKIEQHKYRVGVSLKESGLKLREFVLKTIQARL